MAVNYTSRPRAVWVRDSSPEGRGKIFLQDIPYRTTQNYEILSRFSEIKFWYNL